MDYSVNKYSSRLIISNNSFTITHLNVRVIAAKFSIFLSYMDNLDDCFTDIGLSETWWNPT